MGTVAFRSVRRPSGRHAAPRTRAVDGVPVDPRPSARLAGDELARIYAEHSRSVLQLAALLVPDIGAAREVMYEAFAALDRDLRSRAPSSGDEFSFLLRAVVFRARVTASAPGESVPGTDGPGAGEEDGAAGPGGVAVPEAAVLEALRALPCRQREALVLRYFGQLPDWQAAAAMDVRQAELHAYVERGMSALRAVLVPPGR